MAGVDVENVLEDAHVLAFQASRLTSSYHIMLPKSG